MMAGTRTPVPPSIAANRWRNMVPAAAVLIIGHNDRARVPNIAVPHGVDDIGYMLLASHDVGVAGMLIVDPGKFDERDCRQPVAL